MLRYAATVLPPCSCPGSYSPLQASVWLQLLSWRSRRRISRNSSRDNPQASALPSLRPMLVIESRDCFSRRFGAKFRVNSVNFIRLSLEGFTQIRSDPLIIRLIIFPVVLQMFVLATRLTTEVKNTTITFLTEGNTPKVCRFVQAIRRNRCFAFAGYAESESDCRRRLDRATPGWRSSSRRPSRAIFPARSAPMSR